MFHREDSAHEPGVRSLPERGAPMAPGKHPLCPEPLSAGVRAVGSGVTVSPMDSHRALYGAQRNELYVRVPWPCREGGRLRRAPLSGGGNRLIEKANGMRAHSLPVFESRAQCKAKARSRHFRRENLEHDSPEDAIEGAHARGLIQIYTCPSLCYVRQCFIICV